MIHYDTPPVPVVGWYVYFRSEDSVGRKSVWRKPVVALVRVTVPGSTDHELDDWRPAVMDGGGMLEAVVDDPDNVEVVGPRQAPETTWAQAHELELEGF